MLNERSEIDLWLAVRDTTCVVRAVTARETAVSALASALDGVAGALLRDASRPESIPAGGLIVLREGVADAP